MYREDDSALVFMSSELGEHSITTRNIDVNENTVLQFEVYSQNKNYKLKTFYKWIFFLSLIIIINYYNHTKYFVVPHNLLNIINAHILNR